MKKALILALVFGLFFTFTNANSQTKKKAAKGAKPMVGYVVSVADIAKGGDGKIKREDAEKKAEAGSPLALMIGGKIYFVMNSDGSFAGKQLAKFANLKAVGCVGAKKTVKGINFIIADKITSME